MSRIFFVAFFSVLMVSCLKNAESELGVSTEDIIYTSGEKMVVTGRILATAEVDLVDHGFIVSEDENFTNPFTVSLGERKTPGRFVGEFENLNIDREYYVKSFVQDNQGVIEGNVLNFNTLKPIIDDFSPRIGVPNAMLTIQGRNFTEDSKVYFGGREATIVTKSDESFITVHIPAIANQIFEEISIVMNGETFVSDIPFEYVIGTWEKESISPIDFSTVGGITLKDGDDVIYGLGGINGFGPYVSDLGKYNTVNKTWSKGSLPGFATGYSFSCDGFIGSGSSIFIRPSDRSYSLSTDFYAYENGKFKYEGKLPFRLLKASATRISDRIYVFGGLTEDVKNSSKVYEYNIGTKTWKELAALPEKLVTNSDYPSFVYNGDIYFIGSDQFLYRYSVSVQETAKLTLYPTTISEGGVALVLNDKVYIGVFKDKRLLYELDLKTLNWKEKTGFSGQVREEITAKWVENGKLYILKNGIFSLENSTVWSFSPDEY